MFWEKLLLVKRNRCLSLSWTVWFVWFLGGFFCICLPKHCKLLILPFISGKNLDQWFALSLEKQPGKPAVLCVWGVLLQPNGEMFSVDASYLPCPNTTASHPLVTNTTCENIHAKESKEENGRDSACRQRTSQVELREKSNLLFRYSGELLSRQLFGK